MLAATAAMTPARAASDDPAAPIRGVVRAVQQATIATDLQARVARVGFQEGERFRKGEVLVEFDCRKQRAELEAAEAQHLEVRLTLDNNLLLQRSQAAGKHDVEVSRARVAKAAAEAEALRARVDLCMIAAPWDGRVAELGVNAHEMPQPGKPFMTVVADGQLEIDLVLPSEWLRWLKPGARLQFAVDETGTLHAAEVVRLGAAVDAVSQTIKAVAAFRSPAADILMGMSGTAEFEGAPAPVTR